MGWNFVCFSAYRSSNLSNYKQTYTFRAIEPKIIETKNFPFPVSTLHTKLLVPVTCKIRVFEDVQKTIRYAKMLQNAGCSMLTVHGRTREQKGPLTGLADWNIIRTVR